MMWLDARTVTTPGDGRHQASVSAAAYCVAKYSRKDMIENNAICYEAVQRILRNRLVDYVRLRMTELSPNDHLERLQKPCEKEWDPPVSTAKACRDFGGTDTKVRDDYALLSV